ncbi:hypothetical protein OSTOST_07350 [Ostertagia ostertagi]
MGSRPRGTFPSQQYRSGPEVFFPRYEPNRVRSSNRVRDAPVPPPTYRNGIGSELPSTRGYGAERKRDYPTSGREMDRTDKRSANSQYDRRDGVRRDGPRDSVRGAPHPRNDDNVGAGSRASDSNGNRYKYLDEGWYNAYKPQQPASMVFFPNAPRERDHRAPRNGYESQPSTRAAADRYRYGKGAESSRGTGIDMGPYGVVNSEIVMETRQLEERVAAIQRELEMLEKDNEGNRSSDYRNSRSAYQANSGHLPSLLDFAPPPDAVEKARFEREEVNLRMREQELRRREQELIFEQRRAIRDRAAPPPQYGRVAPPSRPKNATFPKLRSTVVRRPVSTKPSPRKSENDRTTDGLIEQILGKYKSGGDSPRSRSLKELLEYCDVSLLSDDVCQKAGTLIANSEQSTEDDYKTRTCIRTYNPTVLGPLDEYVSLGLFEDEVKMDASSCDAASDKILEDLQSALAVFPRSPAS